MSPPRWHLGYAGISWYGGYLDPKVAPTLVSSVNLPDRIRFPPVGLSDGEAVLFGAPNGMVEAEAALRLLSAKARLSVNSQPALFANSPDFGPVSPPFPLMGIGWVCGFTSLPTKY